MPAADIKAIVFRTTQLEATKSFFEHVLQLGITEMSPQHFVVHAKGIRLVFLESVKGFEIELYLHKKTGLHLTTNAFENCKDPNGINIISFYKK